MWKNSTKEHKSSSNPLGSSPSYRFAVLFIFLALFEGTQKDILSVKVYYCNKVFQTSNMKSEIKSKSRRKHLSCSLPLLYTAYSMKKQTPHLVFNQYESEKERGQGGPRIFCSFMSRSLGQTIFFKILKSMPSKRILFNPNPTLSVEVFTFDCTLCYFPIPPQFCNHFSTFYPLGLLKTKKTHCSTNPLRPSPC
jgi:hypothetical protein